MTVLSIYWNSVWTDAQRRSRRVERSHSVAELNAFKRRMRVAPPLSYSPIAGKWIAQPHGKARAA